MLLMLHDMLIDVNSMLSVTYFTHYYGKGLLKRLFWPLKALKSALIAGAGVGNKSASKSALVDPPL